MEEALVVALLARPRPSLRLQLLLLILLLGDVEVATSSGAVIRSGWM